MESTTLAHPSLPPNKYTILSGGDGIHVFNDKSVTEFSSISKREDLTKIDDISLSIGEGRIALWGEDNLLPQRREALIKSNNITGQLLTTRRNILLGKGLYFYKKEFNGGKEVIVEVKPDQEVLDWMDHVDIDEYLECSAGELVKHGNIPTEFIQSKGSTDISNIYSKRCINIRSGCQDNDGIVRNFYYSGSWGKTYGKTNRQRAIEIPAFKAGARQKKSILILGDKLFFDGYYYYPAYWGSKGWIYTANQIPTFHSNNLDNGYAIRFHIEIPYNYFLDKEAYNNAIGNKDAIEKCFKDAAEKERLFINKMNGFLAGAKNAGRAIYTNYISDLEKNHPGVKITSVKVDLKDEALLKLYDVTNTAIISANGVPPSVASIPTPGKLSSGSDILNSLNMHITVKTPVPRKNLLKPLYIVKKQNNWDPDLEFGFKDVALTTLDQNKSGIKETVTD